MSRRNTMLDYNQTYVATLYKKLEGTNNYDTIGVKFTFKDASTTGTNVFGAMKGTEDIAFNSLAGLQTTRQRYNIYTNNTSLDFKVYDKVKLEGNEKTFVIQKIINYTQTNYAFGQKRSQKAISRNTPKVLMLE